MPIMVDSSRTSFWPEVFLASSLCIPKSRNECNFTTSFMFEHHRTFWQKKYLSVIYFLCFVGNCLFVGRHTTVLTTKATSLTMTSHKIPCCALFLLVCNVCKTASASATKQYQWFGVCAPMFSVARYIYMRPFQVSDCAYSAFRQLEHGMEKYKNINQICLLQTKFTCLISRIAYATCIACLPVRLHVY